MSDPTGHDLEAGLAERPDIVERVRSGDPRALVDYYQEVVGVEVDSYTASRLQDEANAVPTSFPPDEVTSVPRRLDPSDDPTITHYP